MRISNHTFIYYLIGLLLMALCPSATGAVPNVQILGGAEISQDVSYVYAGMVTPLSGSQLGNGIVRRLWADLSTYRYVKNGVTFDARSPGMAASLGVQHSQEDFWWAAFVGATYRYTRISPNDPGSSVQGGNVRANLQLEGEHTINLLWKLSGNASYIVGQDAYWARARLLRSIWSSRQLGLESVIQGDNDYRLSQIGVVLSGMKLSNDINMGLKMGGRRVEGLSSHLYAGVELENRF